MADVPTPHNDALKGQIAKSVLMPGDPLRAQYIAEHYLEDVICFNRVRNMLGFTGSYQGRQRALRAPQSEEDRLGIGRPFIGRSSRRLP